MLGILLSMPTLDLSDNELQNAAQAARVARQQATDDASKQSNPSVRSIFETTARRFAELAAKFEQARKSDDSRK